MLDYSKKIDLAVRVSAYRGSSYYAEVHNPVYVVGGEVLLQKLESDNELRRNRPYTWWGTWKPLPDEDDD